MNKWKQRREQSSQKSSNNQVLTAKRFIEMYLSIELIIKFNDEARESDVEHFAHVLELGQRFRMVGCSRIQKDRSGNEYIYPAFSRNGNNDGGKVLNIGNLFLFVNDLYDRKFVIGFTYDELIEEAEKAI